MQQERMWTDKEVFNFFVQFDIARGVTKGFVTEETMNIFKQDGTLFKVTPKKKCVPLYEIEKIICEYYCIPPERFQSKSKQVTTALRYRQIFQYFLRMYTNMSLSEIAMYFSYTGKQGRHATVLNNIKTITNLSETDKQIGAEIFDIQQKIEKKYEEK